ncbi:MAG: hypothetical protein WBB31_00390, partial [Saprospiraceae bacterium]
MFTCSALMGQWEPLNGPYGGWIHDLKQNEIYQFASTDHGIYRSHDHGNTWKQLTIEGAPGYSSYYFGIHHNKLVASVRVLEAGEEKRFLYKSEDNGDSWIRINRPDSAFYGMDIAINDYGIYIAWNYHLWVSTDEGLTWKYSYLDSLENYFDGLSVYDDHIYVGCSNRLYKSSGSGDVWSEIEVDGLHEGINTINVFDSLIFIREYQYGKLYRSENGGETWTHSISPDWGNGWTNFVKIDSIFYANNSGSILLSRDKGKTWESISNEYVGSIYKMINAGDTILAGTLGEGVMQSTDFGLAFHESNSGMGATVVNAIALDQNSLWTGCYSIGVSRYHIFNGMWDTTLLHVEYEVRDIKTLDNRVFAITDYDGISRSDDNGNSWTVITPIPDFFDFTELYTDGHSILIGGISQFQYSALYISDDYGNTWKPDTFRINDKRYHPSIFARKGNTIFTATGENIFRSTDNGSTWQISSNGLAIDSCWCGIINLFTSDELIFALISDEANYSSKLFISRNNGDTWEFYAPDIHETGFTGLGFITHVDNILLASGSNPNRGGVFVSFDNAITWQSFSEGLSFDKVYEIISDNEYMYAATSG